MLKIADYFAPVFDRETEDVIGSAVLGVLDPVQDLTLRISQDRLLIDAQGRIDPPSVVAARS